jgi:protein involved in polysaccharide export with SLBB domain
MLAGCSTDSQSLPPSPHDPTQDPLRVGDRVHVDLSGVADTFDLKDQDIHEDGTINLPYVGRIQADGKSPSKLEQEITTNYVPRYYPHISVTVTPVARFFFVGGQVNNNGTGGRIAYAGPITIMGAIQAAGDFTPFADKKHVQVTRGDKILKVNCVDALKHPDKDIRIYPGDRIWVGRRF